MAWSEEDHDKWVMWAARECPNTCEDSWHVFHGNAKKCDCGDRSNPAHRTWWQRRVDRWKFNKIQKRRRRRQ